MGCSQSSAALTSENSTVQLSAEDKQKIDELQEQRNQLEQQQQQLAQCIEDEKKKMQEFIAQDHKEEAAECLKNSETYQQMLQISNGYSETINGAIDSIKTKKESTDVNELIAGAKDVLAVKAEEANSEALNKVKTDLEEKYPKIAGLKDSIGELTQESTEEERKAAIQNAVENGVDQLLAKFDTNNNLKKLSNIANAIKSEYGES